MPAFIALLTGCGCLLPANAQTLDVTGSVRPAPAPGHSLQIEVDHGRAEAQVQPDGAFQFPIQGQSGDAVDVVIRDGPKVLYNSTQALGTPWEIQIGSLDDAPPTDSIVARAVAWSIPFSILAGLVELEYRSQSSLVSCLVAPSFLYIALAGFFNTLAAAIAASLLNNKLPGSAFFTPMFYALFGVFAFEAVLSNTNITIFGKGVLAFQEWTAKAREPAVAAVQHRQVQRESDRAAALADKLMKIDNARLTAYVLDAFGRDAGEKLILDSEAYQQRYKADARFLEALGLARNFPDRAASAVRQEKSRGRATSTA